MSYFLKLSSATDRVAIHLSLCEYDNNHRILLRNSSKGLFTSALHIQGGLARQDPAYSVEINFKTSLRLQERRREIA